MSSFWDVVSTAAVKTVKQLTKTIVNAIGPWYQHFSAFEKIGVLII